MALDPQTGLDIPDEQQQAATAQQAADTLQNIPTGPGLSGFDVDSAAQNLAAVGQSQPGAAVPPAVPPPDATSIPPPAPNAAAQPTAGVPNLEPSPADIGPPPEMPQPTGNYEHDIQAFQRYNADLTNYQGRLKQAHAAVARNAAAVGNTQAQRERDLAEENVLRQQEENERRRKERAVQQQAIDQAVQQRMAREQDTGRSWWADASTGDKVAAHAKMIVGAFAQGLSNAAAAYLGQAGNAKNEGRVAIDKLIETDRQTKLQRLASADKSLLDARYGFKDSEENHRAMLNDIDADSAAKYRMIAKQAAADLRARGVPEAEIQHNEDIAALYQKGAEYQDKILDREQQRRLQESHERATEALANANLGVARGGLALRAADFNASLDERKREADLRAETARAKGAEADKAKHEQTITKVLRQWDNDNNVKAAIGSRDKLLGVQQELDDPNASAATIASAIMEFDTAKRQGTATAQSYNALTSHLAPGLLDKMQAMAAHGSGKFTETEKKNLREAVKSAVGVSDKEGERLHNSFMSRVYTDPELQSEKETLGAESESRFGRWGFESDATKARKVAANRPKPAPSPAAKPSTQPGGRKSLDELAAEHGL